MTDDASQSGTRNLARTQSEIVRVATQHFMRKGYHGARVDEIAAETSTTKRMIYYCFKNKDGLFAACLAQAYEGIRQLEQSLRLEELDPTEAVARYVDQTIRYHEAHPELARLVRTENVLGAPHLQAAERDTIASPVVTTLNAVVEKGQRSGQFRSGVTGLELHLAITALANFRITNAPTIEALFQHEMRDPLRLDSDIASYIQLALGWLRPTQV